ncbi:MAG: hypothetical protein V7K92_26135 [Nostoc sp.]|uniref:hypothetical protein n=1 Tax=Nostoc sp. TaxID=1180 RepID=UPI002FEE782E
MSSFKIGHGGATALFGFPGLYPYGDLASKSVSRHLLYLGKPQTLDDSLSLRYRPWRLPFSQRERLAPAVGCPFAARRPVREGL